MENIAKGLIIWNLRCVTAATVVGVGLLVVFGKRLPPEVPLLYSRPWGQEQLVNSVWLWLLPVAGAMVGAGITIWGDKLVKDKILAMVIWATALAVQIVLGFGLLRIVMTVI